MLYPLSYGGSVTARTGAERRRLGRSNTTSARHAPGTRPNSARRGPGADNVAPVTQALGRVLVVDDDEVIRQLIAVNLTLEGFDVATAVDGHDCLDKGAAID